MSIHLLAGVVDTVRKQASPPRPNAYLFFQGLVFRAFQGIFRDFLGNRFQGVFRDDFWNVFLKTGRFYVQTRFFCSVRDISLVFFLFFGGACTRVHVLLGVCQWPTPILWETLYFPSKS